MNHQISITGTVSFTVFAQENSLYLCQISSDLAILSQTTQAFVGQTPEHSIAIALEALADLYRTAAEENQENDQVSEDENEQDKLYHVILHYEDVIEEHSKFEAVHNTLIGNTVVENAKCTVIEISPEIQQQILG